MKIGKNDREKRKTKYILIIGILLVFFAKDIFKYGLDEIEKILYPIQSKIYSFGKKAKEGTENVLNYKELMNENSSLKETLATKSLVEEKNIKLEEENKRLRELLEMKGTFRFDFRVGKIGFQQRRELYESFAINLGKVDGIKENIPVLYQKSLIGKVDKVNEKFSVVQMITYQDSVVSAKADGNILGVIRGNRSDELTFEPVSAHEAELRVGNKIYTSGISDIYPKDIYIGEITEIRKKYGNMVEYIVKVPFNVMDINEVILLTEEGE